MAFVQLNEDGSDVIGLFNYPQVDPQPAGYAEIADDDERLSAFKTANAP